MNIYFTKKIILKLFFSMNVNDITNVRDACIPLCPSVHPPISKTYQTAWPIKTKLHVELPCVGRPKVYWEYEGHMTKVEAFQTIHQIQTA